MQFINCPIKFSFMIIDRFRFLLFFCFVIILSSCEKDNSLTDKQDDQNNLVELELITINIPDNLLNQYIINAVVFASKMDGSLLSSQRFNNSDKTVTLYTEEEIPLDEEFMVTFAVTDNGLATGLSTYANITKEKLSSINLKTSIRLTEGSNTNFGAFGFEPTDNVSSFVGINSFDIPIMLYLNQSREDFNIIIGAGLTEPVESVYIFGQPNIGFDEYAYLLLDLPLENDFVLDKSKFLTEGIQTKFFNISKPENMVEDESSSMVLYGYLNDNDKEKHRYHSMSFTGAYTQSENEYNVNPIFSDYWFSINNGAYYAERKGLPIVNYVIPELAIDYTLTGKKINVNITGAEHEVGKIQLQDYDNENLIGYSWIFNFDSKTTSSIIIPKLPAEMATTMLQGYYDNNTFKVGSVEVYNYFGLNNYKGYLNNLVKNQDHLFDGSDGFEMISNSDFQYYNSPIKDNTFH